MAAPTSERLFSLELLVDWVRLEAGLLPPPPPVVAVEGEQEEAEEAEEEEEEEARPPPPSRDLCPAVAFRLLDFPTLLVYPPEGPGAPAPEPRPGLVRFGRGKSCLFRLHAATLHRLLLRTPLYTLLLQLPPGRPTPAPQLLGACSISLAAAAHQVLGPAASGCSQGRRGSFPLHDHVGQRVGDIALGYRLTDLGSSLLSHLERPVASAAGEVERAEVASQAPRETQQPKSEPGTKDADRFLASLRVPKAQKELREIAFHRQTNSGSTVSSEHGKTSSVCSNSSGVRSVSPPDQEVTELDVETNTFCPPPLYYTHLTQEKMPPVRGTITIKPQINVPEGLNGIFLEENRATAPTDTDCLKPTKSGTRESPPMLINTPHVQDVGASDQTADHAQTEQNRVNTIRQLPLLNALLVELSVLHNQPVASPTQIHPHLAWLYRTEDKRPPESTTKCTCKSESKDKLSMGGNEKSVNLQYKKNQAENLKKGKYFEENSDNPPKRVPRGKLLYGLTKTLKLRLKQTNPDMLVVHEKREQYRKMQAQMLGAKLRIPSSKVKALSFAKVHQKPHQLPKDKCLELDASFAEDSDTSKQISGVLGDPSTSQETKLKCAAEKTVDCKHRISNGLLKEIASPANSIVLEGLTPASILEGKVDMKVQSPRVFQQVAVVDRIVVDKEIENKQVKTTDTLTDNMSENKPSKNSCSESISELKYSDDFTSPCSSEDFSTTEDTSRILQAHDSSPEAENPKYNRCTSKSSETILSIRKNSSEKSSVLSPPFSAGSPVHSYKRSHISKIQDKSLEETSSISTSDLSLLHWTEEKENHIDQNGMHNSKVVKRDQDMSIKLKTRTGGKSSEKSQSPRTSQVSSYLPSNLSELELNALDSSTSDHFEEEDEVASLNISKQCRDICELVINKLPGYTV